MKNAALNRLVVVLGVSALAAFGAMRIMDTDPAPRKTPTAPLAPLVRVLDAQPADHRLQISAHGNVNTADQLAIRPQVGGQLLKLHPNFEPGGVIPAGERLFQIDPTDYQFQIAAAEAAIAKARADIDIEQGKRKVAAEELRLLEGSVSLDEASRPLALRAPQLEQVRAELMRAQNQLEQARTELARTHAELPHDLVVLSRDKVPGEILAARDSIGSVARADRFWVELQIPPTLLSRLRARSSEQPGAMVSIVHQGQTYQAEITRIRAELSDNSRMAGVLAEVADPLGMLPANRNRTPLLIGSYVEARIDAGTLPNTLAIPRTALHNNSRIWLIDADQRLQVRSVEPVYVDEDTVYLNPLDLGEQVLLSSPSGLVPGSKVRIQGAQ
jgi:RND family efflux transporter MFP subunit